MILLMILLTFVFMGTPSYAQVNAKRSANDLDKGDFKVGFSPATKSKNPGKVLPREIRELLKDIADPLNKMLALPYDVYLSIDECGEPNAFYDPETKEIIMCHEFINSFVRTFILYSDNDTEVEELVGGTTAFFFFHELGHCLIDVWDLPATGREEDAVDQLAILILLDGTDEGVGIVLSGALYFDLYSELDGNPDLAFWDVHSLDKQRLYNMLCLTYGSNTEKNKGVVGKRGLPAERASGCRREFNRADRAWERLLTPYLKPL